MYRKFSLIISGTFLFFGLFHVCFSSDIQTPMIAEDAVYNDAIHASRVHHDLKDALETTEIKMHYVQ
jgi:hypothetical protein